jgi:hypothetical protein
MRFRDSAPPRGNVTGLFAGPAGIAPKEPHISVLFG